MKFTIKQKQALVEYARDVLVNIVNGSSDPPKNCVEQAFQEKAGVFVSLHKGKELRGCIGYIEAISSIWQAVKDNTISAATNDIRFMPVEADELADIKIEISILTPPEECSFEEIKQGQDGVIIQQGSYKATYLPQVWESLPEKKQFFGTLCQKAGLDENCWRDSITKFLKYQTITFKEKHR